MSDEAKHKHQETHNHYANLGKRCCRSSIRLCSGSDVLPLGWPRVLAALEYVMMYHFQNLADPGSVSALRALRKTAVYVSLGHSSEV